MNSFISGLWAAIKELLILCFALIIFPVWFIMGILYTLIKHILRWDYNPRKQLAPIIRSISLGIDGMAGAGAGEGMNDYFLKIKGRDKYGKWYETISAVTGMNYLKGNLTIYGEAFNGLLNLVLGKEHTIDAIKKDDEF